MKNEKSIAMRTAFDGMMCACAVALSFLESLLPDMAFLPPGAKPGFANIAVMITAFGARLGDALAVTLAKSLFVLLTRGPAAFFMSISGSLLSFACLAAALGVRTLRAKCSYMGVSGACALMHNVGQLCAAAIYMGTVGVFSYLPLLLVFALVTGGVNGAVTAAIAPRIKKMMRP